MTLPELNEAAVFCGCTVMVQGSCAYLILMFVLATLDSIMPHFSPVPHCTLPMWKQDLSGNRLFLYNSTWANIQNQQYAPRVTTSMWVRLNDQCTYRSQPLRSSAAVSHSTGVGPQNVKCCKM